MMYRVKAEHACEVTVSKQAQELGCESETAKVPSTLIYKATNG